MKGITDRLYFDKHSATYNHTRKNDDDIEYTRTDAIIEKACKWLRNYSHNYADNALGKEYLVNDFKNYIKGE